MPKDSRSTEEARFYGTRFLTEDAPDGPFPKKGMSALDSQRLVEEELQLEGDPNRNLATFVTTWMEPEAERLIAENNYRNFIDHAEYPISAEIEQRCIRMLADLFNAPGETTGARCQGSSEAIMLGALSLKWKWKERREAAGKIGRQAEPRLRRRRPRRLGKVLPLLRRRTAGRAAAGGQVHDRPRRRRPRDRREHDRRRRRPRHHLHRPRRRHQGDQRLLVKLKEEKGHDVPIHVDGASGGFVWPFLYPHSEWDFRLEQVRSINVSGHKFGLVYPGIGWLVFREKADLAEQLVFYENYLGETDATFTLNFSTGASMVLAQYFNFVRLGREGYSDVMQAMQSNAEVLVDKLDRCGHFDLIGENEEQLPLVAFKLKDGKEYDEFDVSWQLSAERGWMLPAYTMPPNAQEVTVLRALVKHTLSRSQIDRLANDIEHACDTLEKKGARPQARAPQGQTEPELLGRAAPGARRGRPVAPATRRARRAGR